MASGRIANYKIGLHRFVFYCGVRNSTVASQPCPLGRITADKKLRFTQITFLSACACLACRQGHAQVGDNFINTGNVEEPKTKTPD